MNNSLYHFYGLLSSIAVDRMCLPQRTKWFIWKGAALGVSVAFGVIGVGVCLAEVLI